MSRAARLVGRFLLASAAALSFVGVGGQSAQAQSVFCPSSIPGQTNIALSGGTCTNGNTGAFSNAALASQALSDLSQSSTQQVSNTVGSAISTRREVEQQRCPEGFERVGGVCQRIATAEPPPPPTPAVVAPAPEPGERSVRTTQPQRRAPRPARPATTAPRVAAPVRAPVYKAPPPIEPAVRVATWAQGFGDYERRTGSGTSSINCCSLVVGGNGLPIPLALTEESRATMGGGLGGIDWTFRNLGPAGSGVILGVLGGYTTSNVKLVTRNVSSDPADLGNGASTMSAHLNGPSAGAYATYFQGAFSADTTLRADFLDLSETFTDMLAFTANLGITPTSSAFSGTGSNSAGQLHQRQQPQLPDPAQPPILGRAHSGRASHGHQLRCERGGPGTQQWSSSSGPGRRPFRCRLPLEFDPCDLNGNRSGL